MYALATKITRPTTAIDTHGSTPHHQRRTAVTDHEAARTARLNGGGAVVKPRVAGLVVTGAASSRRPGWARSGRGLGRRRCGSALFVVGTARLGPSEHAPRLVHGPHTPIRPLRLLPVDVAALVGMVGTGRPDPRAPDLCRIGVGAHAERCVVIGQLGHRRPPARDATSARRVRRRCSGPLQASVDPASPEPRSLTSRPVHPAVPDHEVVSP